MRKTSRLLWVLASASVCSMTVQAAAPFNTGHLYLTGDIAAISCFAGPISGNGDITLDMGSIEMDDIGTIDAPLLGLARRINITVLCPNGSSRLDTVHMTFRPETGGTGLDPNEPRLLANTGTATGVGVALVKDDDTLLNFSSREPIDAALGDVAEVGRAVLTLRAIYVRNGAAMGVGGLVASAPFLLTYE